MVVAPGHDMHISNLPSFQVANVLILVSLVLSACSGTSATPASTALQDPVVQNSTDSDSDSDSENITYYH